MTGRFAEVLAGLRERRSGHDPARVLVDLAVMLADSETTIVDLAVLRDQRELFGLVASTATAWRVFDAVDEPLLAQLRQAQAAARERVWLQAADTGRLPLATTAGGRTWPGLRIMVDVTLVTAHSEEEAAAPTFKGGFGFHPVTVWLDNTGEALAGLLRPGNAGANHGRRPNHSGRHGARADSRPAAARHPDPGLR